ncbi:TolC family protein [Flaviramulus aquimarinus]|uniref:TolC family protein n=1 Tax=Flaviramulus aquimarinus TaxID=1170456 RepID=UPI0031E5D636
MNLKFPIVTLILSVSTSVTGQQVLEDYVETGLASNQQYLKERLNTDIAKEESNISKSGFLPDVSFNTSYIIADGGRAIGFPVGDLFNPAYSALNQLTNSNQFPTNLQNINEQLLPNDFHETKIRVVQPILNTNIYYGYKAKKSMVSVNEAKADAYKNQLGFEIRKAYYNYLKLLEQKVILDSTRVIVKELVRVNGKFVKYDVETKDVLYNAEAQLYQVDAQLATAEKNISKSRNFFNFLLNRDLETSIITDEPLVFKREIYSMVKLQEKALSNRTEVNQIQSGIEASDYEIKRSRGFLIPHISTAAEFGYQGFGYEFDKNQGYYLISFNLSWSIFQGGRNNAQVRKAKLGKQQLEADFSDIKKRIQLEVSTAVYEYEETLKIYDAQVAQLKSSQENFKIIQSKYKQSQVLLVEFNQARTQLTTAQLMESIARFNIKIAKANLNRAVQMN